jgi:hypothetical protein
MRYTVRMELNYQKKSDNTLENQTPIDDQFDREMSNILTKIPSTDVCELYKESIIRLFQIINEDY